MLRGPDMYALPPDSLRAHDPRVAGVSCPDCSGVLAVRAGAPDPALLFICPSGHTYDLAGLLTAKDEDRAIDLAGAPVGDAREVAP